MSTLTRRRLITELGTSAALVGMNQNIAGAQKPNHDSVGPRKTNRPVQIGVVGGNFGANFQWHLHPNSRVTAVCDIQASRLQRLSEVYRCGTTYKAFREMLRQPQLDAVAIFTPVPLHAWMAAEAMKAGKHVISAVPAGMSVEDLEQILETVKTTGLKYMMAETSYYRPEVITCREWAQQGKFGTIFYSESEYQHEGTLALMYDDRGLPTWRYGTPPFRYPTHCTGMIIPVIGERLTEVVAVGWGNGHEVLRSNQYGNPFWNATAFFKTSAQHSCRICVFYHVAAGGGERAQFYGDRLSYMMARPEGSPNTVVRIGRNGRTVLDGNGYPEGDVSLEAYTESDYHERLPEPLRVQTGHGGSHAFLTHEFISAIIEDRQPAVNIWEAIAYTLPGIIAEKSALRGGECMKIKDYGKAPV